MENFIICAVHITGNVISENILLVDRAEYFWGEDR